MDQGPTVEQYLRGKPPEVVALYDRFIELAEECGPFTYSVNRSAITIKGTRRGFAGVIPGDDHLRGYLDLTRAIEPDPRIQRSAAYESRLFVNYFRVTSLDEMDDTFAQWLAESYAVGRGDHLKGPKLR
ncbi:hypothetical protein DY023_01410 [Microbacterium bovistercoris]|uniref:DUF5655 domain-containing protein n=1 Tax=Microbacterium bovistercoris TaxID=2293570 RepID=A0A371NXT0_9MICO|nr:DUF5655 domain-containing protein [Microbacterium bovistercoris]REJ08202.1 hypothetical protein DY023_01410 [Microbacterium bovistercoris]